MVTEQDADGALFTELFEPAHVHRVIGKFAFKRGGVGAGLAVTSAWNSHSFGKDVLDVHNAPRVFGGVWVVGCFEEGGSIAPLHRCYLTRFLAIATSTSVRPRPNNWSALVITAVASA